MKRVTWPILTLFKIQDYAKNSFFVGFAQLRWRKVQDQI